MHTCIHTYIHISACRYHQALMNATRACIHTHMHTYTHTYTQRDMHTCIHTYMHTYIHTHAYMITHMHTCTHAYIHIFACRYHLALMNAIQINRHASAKLKHADSDGDKAQCKTLIADGVQVRDSVFCVLHMHLYSMCACALIFNVCTHIQRVASQVYSRA